MDVHQRAHRGPVEEPFGLLGRQVLTPAQEHPGQRPLVRTIRRPRGEKLLWHLGVGQIQIAGVFDLALAALFLGASRDLERYLPLAVLVAVVAELGHALVRIGHILVGSNPASDLVLPLLMLSFAVLLVLAGLRHRSLALRHAA